MHRLIRTLLELREHDLELESLSGGYYNWSALQQETSRKEERKEASRGDGKNDFVLLKWKLE